MKTALTHGLMLLATLAGWQAATAFAQSHYHRGEHAHGYPHGYGFVPEFGFGFGYSPATAAESFHRGIADLTRARGEANVNHARAQVFWEQARAKHLVNRSASVEQFFALRKLNEQQRFTSLARSRPNKAEQVALSKKAAPRRLGEEHWNTRTDGLAWPSGMHRDEFRSACIRMNELFRLRRDTASSLAGRELTEARELVHSMQATLKGTVNELTPNEYGAAKRFLATLSYEIEWSPLGVERLASN
jgi:hypothetical protein